MEITFNSANDVYGDPVVLFKKKWDSDEELVRKKLVKVWTKMLERYAKPGAHIPDVETVRAELLRVGVDAAVAAYCSAHWWAFDVMVREEIESLVKKELNRFDLPGFMDDVRIAQHDPAMLEHLKNEIRRYVMEGL